MNQEHQEQMNRQEEQQLHGMGAQAGIQTAAKKQERKIENQQFLESLRDADIDSEVFDWLEEEFPTWFSGAHSVTNRGEDWDKQADLLMHNKRERALAERNPGRLLRDRPVLLAIAQGRTADSEPKPLQPMNSEERRAMYGGADVAADLMALSKEKAGLEATTTATTETRVTRESQEDEQTSKIGAIYK